jgi:cell division septum initiation protein DivIVA
LDVEDYLQQLEQLLAEARPMPLSSSVILNPQDVEDVLEELRAQLPVELRQARWIVKERDELLAQAQREADQLMSDTRAERERLLAESEIVKAANREAERIISEGRQQGRMLRLEAEDYVDGKLAELEAVLATTLQTLERGRDRLRGRLRGDEAEGRQPAPQDGQATGQAAQFFDYEQAREPEEG